MIQPGRKYSSSSSKYRYGFNGQEHSDDVTQGNYTAEFWEYDSRIGRRWNLDPKPNVSISPYATFGNNPIINCDPDGDTLTNRQLLAALKIANNEIMKRLNAGQGFGLSSKDYVKPLSDAMTAYLEKNPVAQGDLVDFYKNVHVYYDGLAGAAMWSESQYRKLDRGVINNVGVNTYNTLRLTQGYIKESNFNLINLITTGANIAVGEAAGSLAPTIGRSPVGPRINPSSAQKIVDAGFSQSFVGDYFLLSRSTVANKVYQKEIWALAYTGNNKAGGIGITKVLRSIETEARAAGAQYLIIRGKQVVNERLLNLNKGTINNLGYKFTKIGDDVITLTKNLK